MGLQPVHFNFCDYDSIDFQFYMTKGIHREDTVFHSHDFTELTIITGGSGGHFTGPSGYPLSRGDIVTIIPSVSHALIQCNDLAHYNFIFDANKLMITNPELYYLCGFHEFFCFPPSGSAAYRSDGYMQAAGADFSYIEMLCDKMHQENVLQRPGYSIFMKSAFMNLIIYLARLYDQKLNSSVDSRFKTITDTAFYVQAHYSEPLTIDELASRAGFSKRQFYRLFSEIYHTSPRQYIINCRLEHACRYIKETAYTLTEISILCGFSDMPSFSKAFRKRFGISPREYAVH